jgi:hypothetical protein
LESPLSYTVSAQSTWRLTNSSDFKSGELSNLIIDINDNDTFLKLKLIPKWTQQFPSTKPSARKSHAFISVWGTDKVLLFGGKTGADETWIYDLSDNLWTELSFSLKPDKRRDAAMANIYGTDKILLFGGYHYDGSHIYYNDTWLYDLSNNNWTEIKPPFMPSQRTGHQMASIWGTDKILLFGGFENTISTLLEDTWIYDLSDENWTQIFPVNNPSKRTYHLMSSIYGKSEAFLFGGYDGSNTLDDTWHFDLSTLNWLVKWPFYKPNRTSSSAVATIDKSKFVVLFSGPNINNETWIYDSVYYKWKKELLGVNPEYRHVHGMATIYGQDKAVLFGGEDNSNNLLDDTWIFELSCYPDVGHYFSAKYDTGSSSSFKKIKWDAENTANNKIKFQIRTASEEYKLRHQDFVGPDGSSNTYYITSPFDIWAGHEGDRFIQFKAYLISENNEVTPVLKSVEIIYNSIPNTDLFEPEDKDLINNNKPKLVWNFSDFDSTEQAGFQVLLDDDATFSSVNYDSGEQVSSNQYWQFPTGTGYSVIAEGTWYWKVRTMDDDGKWSTYTSPIMFTLDSKAPITNITAPVSDGFYQSIDIISGFASDTSGGSELNKVEIAIKRNKDNPFWDGYEWVSDEMWLLVKGLNEWSYDISSIKWTSGTQYIFQSRATDIAGNVEFPHNNRSITLDWSKPHSSITSPLPDSFHNKIDIISGTAQDDGNSGAAVVEINIQRVSDKCYWSGSDWGEFEVWLLASDTSKWSYDTTSIKWESNLEYKIISRAKDKVGNIEIPSSGISFMYDNIPPYLTMSINDGAEYTKINEVTINLNAIDSGSGPAQMSYSLDGNTWFDWEPYNSALKVLSLNDDGTKKIFYRVMDKAGNVVITFDTIILDTTPPNSLSILIDDGASNTISRLVNLTLNAVDDISGVHQMSFSIENNTWTPWEEFAVTKSSMLQSGDGKKSIFFKVIDKAGNEADPVFATIILNTSAQFNTQQPGITNGPESLSLFDQTQMILIAAVIILIMVMLFLFMWVQNKRKKTDETLTVAPAEVLQPTFTPVQDKQLGAKSRAPPSSPQPTPDVPPPQVLPAASVTHRKCPVCSSMLTGETKCVYCGWEREKI